MPPPDHECHVGGLHLFLCRSSCSLVHTHSSSASSSLSPRFLHIQLNAVSPPDMKVMRFLETLSLSVETLSHGLSLTRSRWKRCLTQREVCCVCCVCAVCAVGGRASKLTQYSSNTQAQPDQFFDQMVPNLSECLLFGPGIGEWRLMQLGRNDG